MLGRCNQLKHRLTLAYLLNLFDLLCTLLWDKRGGFAIEVNPIGRYRRGANLAIPVKTIGIGAAMFALYARIKRKPQYAWTSWLVLAVYAILALYILEPIL